MKVADGGLGPSLELNGTGEEEGYLRWRDWHTDYENGQKVCYVHQIVVYADGADPYKVWSDGDYEVNHTGDVLEDVEDAHKVKELNSPENLELVSHTDHFVYHVDGKDRDRHTPVQRRRYDAIREIIEDHSNGQGAPLEVVEERAVDALGEDREQISHDLDKMLRRGDVYEPRTDRLRTT